MTHTLKSWPQFFSAIKEGTKTHDLRSKNDREFSIGDILLLQEYDPVNGEYTGRSLSALVTYITSNTFPCAYSSAMLNRDACILSIKVIPGTYIRE